MTASLERRVTIAVSALLLAWAALAWVLTAHAATQMSGMVLGLGQLGTRLPDAMSAPVFAGMWLTMMVAMMFPAIGPMVVAHRMVTSQRGESWTSTLAFVVGYIVLWTAAGAAPFAALIALGNLPSADSASSWIGQFAGTILIVAGAYQFTPLKSVCLRTCRTPLGFILTHGFRSGASGALRTGIVHGAFCLGCCWALMAILIVVGLMNLAWMAALSAVFLLEKNWRRGVGLSRLIGVSLVLLGTIVIVRPALLGPLSAGSDVIRTADPMRM